MSRSSMKSAASAAVGVLALSVLTACGDDAPSVTVASTPPSTSSASSSSSSAAPSPTASTSAPTQTTPPESTAPSPASSSIDGTRSDLVRFCTPEQVDNAKKACRTSEKTIKGKAIHCSASLPPQVQGSLRASLYRNGSMIYEGTLKRTASTGSVILSFSVGDLQLSEGTYTCRFRAGDTWVGEAKVEGPKGRATQPMACDPADMYVQGSITHCKSNNESLSAASASGVACSGLVSDLMGRKVSATLRTPIGAKDVKLSDKYTQGAAVVHLKAPSTSFGGTVPTGDYQCDFKVDDKTVLSVPFKVA